MSVLPVVLGNRPLIGGGVPAGRPKEAFPSIVTLILLLYDAPMETSL